jgi:small subunit ribosomal protein S19
MAKKEFSFKGMTEEELKNLPIEEFIKLIPSRSRRTLKRGFTEEEKKVLEKIRSNDKNIKTHARAMVIVPEMIGQKIKIHNGKEFVEVLIAPEMAGHILGEFALTRRRVAHNSPGVGATRSSSSVSVR